VEPQRAKPRGRGGPRAGGGSKKLYRVGLAVYLAKSDISDLSDND